VRSPVSATRSASRSSAEVASYLSHSSGRIFALREFASTRIRAMLDQEKTQAVDPHAHEAFLREVREKRAAFANQVEAAGCARAMSDAEILAALFSSHPPNNTTLPKYAAINQAAKNFAEVVLQNCPRCSDRSAAIELIRTARMTANAAVALDGLSL
jgi:hypothetical protein